MTGRPYPRAMKNPEAFLVYIDDILLTPRGVDAAAVEELERQYGPLGYELRVLGVHRVG